MSNDGYATSASLVTTGASIAAAGGLVGWVVGGGTAAAGGIVALVQGLKNRRLRKAEAIRWAKKLGLPDAEKVPAFVMKLARKDRAWRVKKLVRYKRVLSKIKERQARWRRSPGGQRTLQIVTFGIKRGPERLSAQRKRVEARIALIEALHSTMADRRIAKREEAQLQAQAQAEELAQAQKTRRVIVIGATLAGVAALLVVGVIALRRYRRTR